MTHRLVIIKTILHSNSLPGFADGDQQPELNQTLPNGRRSMAMKPVE